MQLMHYSVINGILVWWMVDGGGESKIVNSTESLLSAQNA